MNKKLIVIWMLLLSGMAVFAQNPGYRGKRVSLYYNLYTMNALNAPNESGNSGILSFNTTHTANLDFAVNRRLCLGAAFEYLHTSFSYSEGIHYQGEYDPYDYNYSYQNLRFSSRDVGKMEAYCYGLYLKRFFKGNIAPLGTYIKPQVTLIKYSVYPGNPVSLYGQSLSEIGLHLHNDQNYYKVALSLELGQTRVFFNRMFIDYGVRLGVMPNASDLVNSEREYNAENYLAFVPFKRLASHYLINAKAGIGVLLF